MSVELFVAALALGAALLALWLYARFPSLAPKSAAWTLVNLVAAGLVLYLVPDASSSLEAAVRTAFLLVLPGLVYVFLASIWMLRLMQNATGLSR
jgi:hypothetical protein